MNFKLRSLILYWIILCHIILLFVVNRMRFVVFVLRVIFYLSLTDNSFILSLSLSPLPLLFICLVRLSKHGKILFAACLLVEVAVVLLLLKCKIRFVRRNSWLIKRKNSQHQNPAMFRWILMKFVSPKNQQKTIYITQTISCCSAKKTRLFMCLCLSSSSSLAFPIDLMTTNANIL